MPAVNQNPLVRRGYQIGADNQLEPKPLRPKSIGEARQQIHQVFERLRWDEDSQSRYFAIKGIAANTVEDLSPEQVRLVIGLLETSKMILYRD